MIRINLLPVRKTQQQQSIKLQLAIGGAAIGVALLIAIGWDASLASTVAEKTTQVSDMKREIAKLDEVIGEVNEYTTKRKELQDKLEIIEKLKKGKTGPVRALDDLASNIPQRIWLTAMKETNGSVSLSGLAVDHEDVSAFMKALQKSKYFTNIVLSFSKAKQEGGVTLYEFQLSCSVNYAA